MENDLDDTQERCGVVLLRKLRAEPDDETQAGTNPTPGERAGATDRVL